jgi:hypothetical protein
MKRAQPDRFGQVDVNDERRKRLGCGIRRYEIACESA